MSELKVSKPELEAALLAEAPRQWQHFQRDRSRRQRGKPKWQRDVDDINGQAAGVKARAEEMRRQHDPMLMRITANLERKAGVTSGLHCPKCHDPDMGNKMNGKPWCLKCNVPLESPFLVKKSLPDVKLLPKSKRLDVTFRGLNE
jgi:cytochrome c